MLPKGEDPRKKIVRVPSSFGRNSTVKCGDVKSVEVR